MNLPELLRYGRPQEPFMVEYLRRTEPFTMMANHYHPYYEVYYLISGKREYFIKDTSYSIQAGDLVFIDKNELHKTLQAGEAAHERLIIHFDERFIRSMSPAHAKFLLQPFLQSSHVIRWSEPERSMVSGLFSRMLQEAREQNTAFELTLSHSIVELLLTSARYLQKHELISVHNDSPIHTKISEIVRYLNAHYVEPVSLNGLSAQFAISPYYLSRMFKEVTGFALTDYLNLMRVKEAQRLLGESNMKIIDVAAVVGFENFSHFGKTFKRITHASPREFRKQYQGTNFD